MRPLAVSLGVSAGLVAAEIALGRALIDHGVVAAMLSPGGGALGALGLVLAWAALRLATFALVPGLLAGSVAYAVARRA